VPALIGLNAAERALGEFKAQEGSNLTDRWRATNDADGLNEQQACQYPNLDNQYRILS
jgi:hypothetical protein